MSNVNEVKLIGNVGQVPEIKNLESGGKIGSFSIAVNDYFTDSKGQPQTRTNWFRVILYGKILEAVEGTFTKGDRVFISGELRQRDYLNSKQEKVNVVEISCSVLYVFARKES